MKMQNQKNVIIIPARGNSKGMPNKNLTKFCGKLCYIGLLSRVLK